MDLAQKTKVQYKKTKHGHTQARENGQARRRAETTLPHSESTFRSKLPPLNFRPCIAGPWGGAGARRSCHFRANKSASPRKRYYHARPDPSFRDALSVAVVSKESNLPFLLVTHRLVGAESCHRHRGSDRELSSSLTTRDSQRSLVESQTKHILHTRAVQSCTTSPL